MIAYIDAFKERFVVEPICEQLPIAPSTYYAAKSRPPSARTTRNAAFPDGDAAQIKIHRPDSHISWYKNGGQVTETRTVRREHHRRVAVSPLNRTPVCCR
jgi:hypothetical protein